MWGCSGAAPAIPTSKNPKNFGQSKLTLSLPKSRAAFLAQNSVLRVSLVIQSNMTKQQFILDLAKSLLTDTLSASEFDKFDERADYHVKRVDQCAKDALAKATISASTLEKQSPDIFNDTNRVVL